MAKIKQLFTLIISLAIIWALNSQLGPIPPLGKLVNPFYGFWQNAESSSPFDSEKIEKIGLKEEVEILFDKNLIPHIYAKNTADMLFAQGYIAAKLRLWQMDFLSRLAGGRLSEVLGARTIKVDQFQRRMGMSWSADVGLEALKSDPESFEILEAYCAGVNAYISSLRPEDYPLEFKILDYEPEAWTPKKTILLQKYMSWDLTGDKEDFAMTGTLHKLGRAKMDSIFRESLSILEPIIPAETIWDFSPDSTLIAPANSNTPILPEGWPNIPNKPDRGNGSNNWAVSGSKTASGRPILANDPHLNQRLPSIWMINRLNAPGYDVMGVSIPGAPFVIIGFNQELSWGWTNVDPDILDWYKISFKDDTYAEYQYDGEWKKTEMREEVIHVKGSEEVKINLPITHHGPVSFLAEDMDSEPQIERFKGIAPWGFAMKWAAHLPSGEIRSLSLMNQAKSYDDFVEALSYWECPAQNFLFASKSGDISLWVNGHFPKKWKNQGKYLLDGSNPAHEWGEPIPHLQKPYSKNPGRAFLSSANQPSADSTYPYYINWEFDNSLRGRRINKLLEPMTNIKPQDFMKMQLDDRNLIAEEARQPIIELLEGGKWTENETLALGLMKEWDGFNDPNSIGASIFTYCWEYIERGLWNDELKTTWGVLEADKSVTIDMIKGGSNSIFWDDMNSDQKENKVFIIRRAFKNGIKELETKFGPDPEEWKWYVVNNPSVPHMLELNGFGKERLKIGGGNHIVNKQKHKNGPSWRFVIEMTDKPNAFGAIPGGQSGNPGSHFYTNLLEPWSKGELVPLELWKVENFPETELLVKTSMKP